MATTKKIIREWLERGKEEGAIYVIIVCDTFDYEDYPVMVKPNEDVLEIAEEYDKKNMQKIMVVYTLKMDWEKQLNSKYVFNY